MAIKYKSLWFTILLILIIFLSALFVYKEFWVPTNGLDFSLKTFLIYNFTIKVIGYAIKLMLIYFFFKFVLLVFDTDENISLFQSLILAETIYVLTLKGFLLFHFIFNNNVTKEFISTYESKASLASFAQNNQNSFQHLIGFATIFDLIYIVTLVFIIAEELKISFFKSFKIIGLSYLALLLFIGIIKTFLSL